MALQSVGLVSSDLQSSMAIWFLWWFSHSYLYGKSDFNWVSKLIQSFCSAEFKQIWCNFSPVETSIYFPVTPQYLNTFLFAFLFFASRFPLDLRNSFIYWCSAIHTLFRKSEGKVGAASSAPQHQTGPYFQGFLINTEILIPQVTGWIRFNWQIFCIQWIL